MHCSNVCQSAIFVTAREQNLVEIMVVYFETLALVKFCSFTLGMNHGRSRVLAALEFRS